MESLLPLVDENLRSALWFRPEMALTFGTLVLFVLDLVWSGGARRGWRSSPPARSPCSPRRRGSSPSSRPTRRRSSTACSRTTRSRSSSSGCSSRAGALTVVIAAQGQDFPPERIGQFFALLMAIVLGMFMMASATDLLMVYMSIELVSMVSYVLAGFRKGDRKAAEGSLKYVIYGGVASGVMLFGMSYLYGLTGTTSLLELGAAHPGARRPAAAVSLAATRIALVVAIVFVTAGIGYKVAAVPWHMWCPDVYEGAPTPFTAFLSVGPKAAGFALAIRIFHSAFAGPSSPVDRVRRGARRASRGRRSSASSPRSR